jgi:REP element-mobilizing transposase RayT
MNYRAPFHDYRDPRFYLFTMVALNRRPLFSTCENNRVVFTKEGAIVYHLWHDIPRAYPEIVPSTFVLMPDHLHGILHVTRRMEKPIGVVLRAFKSQVTSALRDKHGDRSLNVWERGYHDHILSRAGALKAFTHYLMDNPRRYCLKKANPDLFRRINILTHPLLQAGQNWNGYGNLFLLDLPEKRAVRVSRHSTAAEIAALQEKVLLEAARGVAIVSPFISPGEKAVANAILAAPKGFVILMKPSGFPPFFKPKGRYFDLCAQGRLLIVSPNLPPVSPITREACLAMNGWCETIGAGGANGGIARVDAGGPTETFAADAATLI